MYSANTVATIKKIQTGLQYLALMHFSSYMCPPQANVQDGASFDYIIVGAGTAGSVIANRLTEDSKISVLLIEAGGDAPVESVVPGCLIFLRNSRFDWNYTTEPDMNTKRCHQKPCSEISLGKMLGGTSALNYMIYSRGFPTDYDNWANITKDSTWEWKNLLPYFKKSIKMEDPAFLKSRDMNNYGTDGLMGLTKDNREYANNILESFKQLGHDILNDPGCKLGYSKMLLYLGTGGRRSNGLSFLSSAKDRKNLYVLKNTFVTKIIFDKKKRAVGVEAITEDGKTVNLKAKKEVIVSAGAINSAKLLQLSGIGPKKDLECFKIKVLSDLPVGQNLQDHVGVILSHTMEKSKEPLINPNEYLASSVIGYAALDKCQDYPDYETLSFYAHANLILPFYSFAYRLNHKICDKYASINDLDGIGKMGLSSDIIHLNPKSRGSVTLKSSDPMDPPVISTGYLSNKADLEDLVKYIKEFIPIVNTTFFRSIEAEMIDLSTGCDTKNGIDEYWKCYASCMFNGLEHYSGTCAMGSVVDSRLRVLGVKRLRVADASIMPVITRGNTNGPVVMIGEKAADFIKEEHVYDDC